ncbi:hypothetical protein [Microbulbifer sp. GL-2]|uniref:hypothetical protein n=1 Tax=Microbulbifer sp. GL-2 TaxID=2591606 RepID=UPI001162D91D|nr:hypothetical protein [Microbulbifer sp. GL-2]BBM00429.1 hypothetical protein GL2_05030 [Microbulbifer sp. GL-2]
MIEYRFEKEKEIALHYANEFDSPDIVNILHKGKVASSEEATSLTKFYWKMVDALVEDSKNSAEICGEANLQEWSEYLMGTFRSYLKANGYSAEWDKASDSE